MMLFDTGIRINELIEMRQDQIQDSYFIIYGKGRKERIVPKNPLVSKTLIKYQTAKAKYFQCRRAEDYLFLSKNGYGADYLRVRNRPCLQIGWRGQTAPPSFSMGN